MSLSFVILALLAIAGAIGVVALRNPIHSALSLIVNMVALAGFYALLEAHFLATVQIIVYAGAIIVLVVFVIMLLNIKQEQVESRGIGLMALGSIFGIIFMVFVGRLLSDGFVDRPLSELPVVGSVEQMGVELYTKYVFTFEMAGVLLLAAIVGATMLAKRENSRASEG